MSKIITKEKKIKNKGQYIRVRHIYRIFNVPIFFRDDKISYAKEIIKDFLTQRLYGYIPMTLAISEYIAREPNILEQTQNLLANLAPKEARKVLLIIKRLQEMREKLLSNKAIHTLELRQKDEIDALNAARNFQANIVKMNDIYIYDGYFLPKMHGISTFFYRHGLHILESKTLDSMKNKDFIDVGGYIGDSAIIFEREFCDKKIHTFEATKANFKLMLKTLELNKSKRIIPVNKGLGAKNESIEIAVNDSCSTMNSEVKTMNEFLESEMCEIITLDSYVRENNVDVGFIKVDIEGFEQEFLKGAIETISRFKPAMLISIYHNGSDFFKIKPLIESWNLGYTFKFFKPVDGTISIETALYCEVKN
ncbi:FkbM family methyltransferase [Helicobacter saguini]|nr:FkbM family methyltransferase [Helicobacter saguini]MWV62879.1 FkbM family methyltransferase [Helicobacter saguini]MWV71645.1 FkbM family methyltransferase [Helicobacter saguini]